MGKAYGMKGGTFGEYVEEDVGNPLLSWWEHDENLVGTPWKQ